MTYKTKSGKKVGTQRASRYDLSAIEGFILVVHTSLGGDQLAFRYPPVTRSSISEETWMAVIGRSKPNEKAGADSNLLGASTSSLGSAISASNAKSTTSGKTGETPTSPNEPPVSISYSDTYTPYDMPSVMLCNILSPKQSLCDRIFHTIIDQYIFVGFPTMVQKDSATTPTTEQPKAEEPKEVKSEKIGLHSSLPRSSSTDLKTISIHSTIASHLHPIAASSSNPMLATGVQSPAEPSSSTGPSTSTTQGTTSAAQHKDELTMFNLVMVVPKEVSWDVSVVSQRIAVQIASALRHEQERCQYVSGEVFKMLRLRERWFTQHRRPAPDQPPPTHTALTYEMLQHSSLAQLIKNIYHSIRDDGSAQIAVNGWLNVSLNTNMIYLPRTVQPNQTLATGPMQLPQGQASPASIGLNAATTNLNSSGPSVARTGSANPATLALKVINDAIAHQDVGGMRPLRPYHTLLLIDQSRVLALLPPDCSPALRKVVEKATPTKSFREMQLELGIPLNHLYQIATHLVYWKHAKIIDVLTRNNMYILNPTPKDPQEGDEMVSVGSNTSGTFHLPHLIQTFEAQFAGVKLIELLNRFSTPKKLSDIMQSTSSQSKFVDMVTWLIRHDLIIQAHQFCYLICPKLIPTSSSTPANTAGSNSSSTGATQASMRLPSGMTRSTSSNTMHSPTTTREVASTHDRKEELSPAFSVDSKDSVPLISTEDSSNDNESHGTSASADPSIEVERSRSKISTNAIPMHNPVHLIQSLHQQAQYQSETSNDGGSKDSSGATTGATHVLSPIPLTHSERLALSNLDNGSKDFKLFLRLCPYFRGAHHLTEIAWRENITKEELLKVLGMYKHIVITTICHEEPINAKYV